MSAQAYLCTSCGHRFSLEPGEQQRCPKCLRQSGLAPDSSAEAAGAPAAGAPKAAPDSGGGGSSMTMVAAVLVVAAIGAAVWYFTRGPADASPPAEAAAGAATTGGNKAAGADVSTVPPPWNSRLDASTTGLKSAASKWPKDAAALVAEIAKAVPQRTADMDFEVGAPHPASALANKTSGLRASSLELVSLAAGILRENGGAAEYGVVTDHYHAKTAVLLRRFAVRAKGGKWLDPMTGGEAKGTVEALSDGQVLANVLALKAMVAVDHRKADDASKAAGHAKRLAPNDPAILFAYGEVQLFNELTDMGMASLESVAKDHADAMTWQTLGEYAQQNRQLFKAQQFYVKAAEADPKFVKPYIMLAQLSLERLEVTPKAQHEGLFGQIDAHIAKAQKIDAKSAGIRTIQAQVALARGDGEAAGKLMTEEVQLHPMSRNAVLSLAQYHIQQKQLDEASEVLEKAAKRGVPGYELHVVLGGLLAAQELHATAREHLEKALKMAPYDPRLRPQVAQLYVMTGNAERAQELLNEQVKRFPEDSNSRLLLAQMAVSLQDWKGAKAQLAAMGAAAANDPRVAILAYFVALATKENVEKAEQAAILAVQGKRSNLAQVLLEQGMLKEAEKLLQDALVKEPKDEQVPYMLVAMMAAQGRDKDAQVIVDQVVKKTPKDQLDKVAEQFKLALEQGKKVNAMPLPPGGAPPAATPEGDKKPEGGDKKPEAGDTKKPATGDAKPKAGGK